MASPSMLRFRMVAIAWFHSKLLPTLTRRVVVGFGVWVGLREELGELLVLLKGAMLRTDIELAKFRALAD